MKYIKLGLRTISSGTDEPLSRIMRLEDTDGPGQMDKSTVFIDKLMLPRMILTLDDRLIVNEAYSYDLRSYRDTDSDGVADEMECVYHNPKRRGGDLEHQAPIVMFIGL